MAKKRTRSAIARDIRQARAMGEKLEAQLRDCGERESNLESEYMDAIGEEAESILKKLNWSWPGSRGRRQVTAAIKDAHRIRKLTAVLRYSSCTLPCGASFSCYRIGWSGHDYALAMSLADAKKLGLKKPGAPRARWSSMREKLKKAGITDEAKLAELLKAKGGE